MKFGKGGSDDGGSFEKPPTGWSVGVLCGVYDLGVRETPGSTFGPKHQVCLWWELHRKDSSGKAFGLRDVVTASTFEGSHLSSRIEALIGRPMTDDEREGFDPRPLIGKRARLLLATSPKKPLGNPFVKVCGPVEESDPKILPEGNYLAEVPPFVAKIVGETEAAALLEEAKAGGGDSAIVWRGKAQAQGQGDLDLGSKAAPPPAAPSSGPYLPEGWRAHQTADGETYFERPDGSTTWDAPEPPKAPPPPAAPAKAPPPVKGSGRGKAKPKAEEAPAAPIDLGGEDPAETGETPF